MTDSFSEDDEQHEVLLPGVPSSRASLDVPDAPGSLYNERRGEPGLAASARSLARQATSWMSADISDRPGTRRGGGIARVPVPLPRTEPRSVSASPQTFTTVHGFARSSTSGGSSLDALPGPSGSPAQPASLRGLAPPVVSPSTAEPAPPQLSTLSRALRQSLRVGASGDLAQTMQQVSEQLNLDASLLPIPDAPSILPAPTHTPAASHDGSDMDTAASTAVRASITHALSRGDSAVPRASSAASPLGLPPSQSAAPRPAQDGSPLRGHDNGLARHESGGYLGSVGSVGFAKAAPLTDTAVDPGSAPPPGDEGPLPPPGAGLPSVAAASDARKTGSNRGGGAVAGSVVNDIAVGVVNTVISLPVSVAFTNILYGAAVYKPFIPALCRLLIGSNALEQLVVTPLSRLPFMVAQVQDIGLIFLNAMTNDIAARMAGAPAANVLGTAMLMSCVTTVVVGLSLFLVGRFRLAGFVSYIPLPVVAGYLAYVGYFCLAAGVGQGTALPIGAPNTWALLWQHAEALPKAAATFGCAGVIFWAVHMWRSPAALPTVLMAIPALWYAALGAVVWLRGLRWADAVQWLAEHEWTAAVPDSGGQPIWDVYALFNLVPFEWRNFGWLAMAHQLPTVLAVCIVCSFGTSMDIMAVQAEVPEEIDADKEIAAVGLANAAAGLFTGGGPGSVIFSQCVLAIRAGVASRVQGYALFALQFATFLVPISLVHFLPNFYYGSLLIVIGMDIMHEWLLATWPRVKKAEFVLSWLSFASTLFLTTVLPVQGLEAGMLVGVVLCSLHFAYEYSVMQLVTFTVSPSRSTNMLPFRYQQMLGLFRGNMIAVSVSGYIFFGSMVEIGRRLRSVAAQIAPRPPRDLLADAGLDPDAEGAPLLDAAAAAAAAARRFLLLDLRRVTGIDATTASAFAMLRRSLEARGVTMVLTGVADAGGVKRMLMANGVIAADGAWEGGRGCPAFETLDAALLWCEEHFRKIAVLHGLVADLSEQSLTLEDVLKMHLSEAAMLDICTANHPLPKLLGALESYMQERTLDAGAALFERGDAADAIYIVLSGSLVSVMDFTNFAETRAAPSGRASVEATADAARRVPDPPAPAPASSAERRTSAQINSRGKVRIVQAGPGSVIGELDWVLRRPRAFQCLVASRATVLALTRGAHERMTRDDPHANGMLLQILLRSSMLTTAHAMHALERAVH